MPTRQNTKGIIKLDIKMEIDRGASSPDEEMLDLADDPSQLPEHPDASIESVQSIGSGSRPLPARWTRIISTDDVASEDIQVYPIKEDIDALPSL